MPRDKTGHFYYSWFPTIYQGDTQTLTLAEDGAYRRLLDHYMTTRAPLPNDDRALARIAGVGLSEWEPIKERVRTYFKPTGLLLRHDFCDERLKEDDARIEKSRNNGKGGGRPTTKKDNDNNPSGNRVETPQKPLPTLNNTKEESKKVRKRDTRSALSPPEFEDFWKLYPKSGASKAESLKAYCKAIQKGAAHADIIRGVAAYSNYLARSGDFTAHATTWLNQQRWTVSYATIIPRIGHKFPSGNQVVKSTWESERARLAAKYDDEERQEAAAGHPDAGVRPTEAIR